MVFLLLALLLGLKSVGADSYQHWITFYEERANKSMVETKHSLTRLEMSDIYGALVGNKILPNDVYRLSTGVVYKIPQPSLFLEYIERCVKVARPSATTAQLVFEAISTSERTQWGNDISVRVRNYYYSSLNKKVQFNDNYSGADEGVWVLVIDGTPTIKCDCGNPLERIGEMVKATPPKQDPPPPPPPPPTDDNNQAPKKVLKVNKSVQDLGKPNQDPRPQRGEIKIRIGDVVISLGILTALILLAKHLLGHSDDPDLPDQGIDPPPNPGNTNTGGPGIDPPPNGG